MTQTNTTLKAIRECLAKNMPPHGKAMLFGSQARGTARADSDWDILVILDKDTMEEVSATIYPFKKQKYQTWICCSYVQMDSINPRIA